MPGLASARSIFEQNIQKNKEAGFNRNILGQSANSSSRPKINVRRNFAPSKILSESTQESRSRIAGALADASSSKSATNNHQRRKSSLSQALSDSQHGSSSKGQASSAIEAQYTVKPAADVPPPPTEMKDNASFSIRKVPSNIAITEYTAPVGERISQNFPFAAKNAKRRPSMSLTDQLAKDGTKTYHSLRKTRSSGNNNSDNMDSSQKSLEAHRDHFKLPDFRQSSYVKRNTGNSRIKRTLTPTGNDMDNSQNSVGSLGSLDMSNSKLHGSSNSLTSLSPKRRQQSLDESFNIRIKRSTSRSKNNGNGGRSATERLSMSSKGSNHGQNSARADPIEDVLLTPPSVRNKLSSKLSSRNLVAAGRASIKSNNNRSLAQHLAANNNATWIKRSSVVEDDESCSSSHHSQPFTHVPFTKSIIKRHGSNRKLIDGGPGRRESTASMRDGLAESRNDMRRESMSASRSRGGSNRSLGGNSSSHHSPKRRSSMRRRGSSNSLGSHGSNHSRRSRRRRSRSDGSDSSRSRRRRAPRPDPQVIAMQAEIEELERQIQASEAKIAQVQLGEQNDLKKVQEVKERKMRRIENAERKKTVVPDAIPMAAEKPKRMPSNPTRGGVRRSSLQKAMESSSSSIGSSATKATIPKEESKEVKQEAQKIKQDNAKIHDQMRKTRLETASVRSQNQVLQERIAEMKMFFAEVKYQMRHSKQEHDQFKTVATTYKQSILDLRKAIAKKAPAVEKVKAARLGVEDKIEAIVALMQEKCSDFQLVEELSGLAGLDESGWEDNEDDFDSDEDRRRSYISSQYSNKIVDSDDESPRSVADLLVPTSNHSLHLFLE